MENLFVELELEEPVDGSRLMTKPLSSCGEIEEKFGKRLDCILIKGNPGKAEKSHTEFHKTKKGEV